MHRIRETMKPADAPNSPMGGEGKTVEADWTYVRRKPGMKVKRGLGHMRPVFSLVERDGSVRSLHVPNVRADNLNEAMQHASSKSRLMTDGAPGVHASRLSLCWAQIRCLTSKTNTCAASPDLRNNSLNEMRRANDM